MAVDVRTQQAQPISSWRRSAPVPRYQTAFLRASLAFLDRRASARSSARYCASADLFSERWDSASGLLCCHLVSLLLD